MPTKKTRRAHNRMPEISPALLSHISEGLWPMPQGGERELIDWKFLMSDQEKREIFEQVLSPKFAAVVFGRFLDDSGIIT